MTNLNMRKGWEREREKRECLIQQIKEATERTLIEFSVCLSFILPSLPLIHTHTPIYPSLHRHGQQRWTVGREVQGWIRCGSHEGFMGRRSPSLQRLPTHGSPCRQRSCKFSNSFFPFSFSSFDRFAFRRQWRASGILIWLREVGRTTFIWTMLFIGSFSCETMEICASRLLIVLGNTRICISASYAMILKIDLIGGRNKCHFFMTLLYECLG